MANRAIVRGVEIHSGDTIAVYYRLLERELKAGKTKKEVVEEKKERLQIFEGIVIAIKGSGENRMFTVRRIGRQAVGIERIFPAESPWISKIVIKKRGEARRSKLYYLRKLTGKSAEKVKEKKSETATDKTPETK